MSQKKVTVKWSKTQQDWVSKYPEMQNRNGRICGNAFFTMIQEYEKFMSKNWEGKPTGFTNLRTYLLEGGFDPDTFQISVQLQQKNDI